MPPWRPLAATAATAVIMAAFVGLSGPTTAQTTPTATATTTPTTETGNQGWGDANPTGIATGVSAPGGNPSAGDSAGNATGKVGGGSTTPCQWTLVGSQANGNGIDAKGNTVAGAAGGYSGTAMTAVPPTASGTWYLETCPGHAPVSIFVLAGTAGPPSAPPPPPSPIEATQLTPFPIEVIHHNPCHDGLTGLTSWFWATVNGGPISPISVSAGVRGYTVNVTAHPTAYHWTFGNGASATSYQSGTEQNPSVSYLYQTKGTYDVTVTVQWAGTYSFSGYGIHDTEPVGPVNQATQHLTWRVQEIRSILVDPNAPLTTQPPANVPNAC